MQLQSVYWQQQEVNNLLLLYMSHPVLSQLCLTFQSNDFGLAHCDSFLQLCLWSLQDLSNASQITYDIENNWVKFQWIFGDFDDGDKKNIKDLAKTYCHELDENLQDTFPQAPILSAFRALDPLFIRRMLI